eukprot:COSAG01_NODE_2976_length_6765_cov_22.300480_6_plen_133_part_00
MHTAAWPFAAAQCRAVSCPKPVNPTSRAASAASPRCAASWSAHPSSSFLIRDSFISSTISSVLYVWSSATVTPAAATTPTSDDTACTANWGGLGSAAAAQQWSVPNSEFRHRTLCACAVCCDPKLLRKSSAT